MKGYTIALYKTPNNILPLTAEYLETENFVKGSNILGLQLNIVPKKKMLPFYEKKVKTVRWSGPYLKKFI